MPLKQWLEKLQPGEMPIFRHTRERLAGLESKREDVSSRDVAQIVMCDPLATMQLLQSINARLQQRYGTEVLTVENALMLQGVGKYIDAALRLPVLEDTPAGKDAYCLTHVQRLARKAQHAAWQARDFAVLHADINADEVEIAAILYFIPDFWLWLRTPETAARLRRLRLQGKADADHITLGVAMHELRLALFAQWSLPETVIDLFSDKHAGRSRQVILAACIDIAERSERGWWHESLIADYEALAKIEATPVDVVIANVHANAARAARHGNWLPQATAGTWGPMLPGVWPSEPGDEDEAAPAQPSSPPATSSNQSGEVCPMPDKQALKQTLESIETHLDQSLNLNQMCALILKGVHQGLGLTRVLFALVTPDGEHVKSRFTLGIPKDDPLRHFEFGLQGKDLFCQLMGKMQGLWVNEGNREKLWPMIQPGLRKMIGVGDFYAMSLHAGNKPLGMIYADRGHGQCGLDNHTYTDFKMLCLQAARGLGKIKP